MEEEVFLSEVMTQEDLDKYIRKLPPQHKCAFTINRPIPLCGNDFICPYKGRDEYSYMGGKRRECKREQILRHKRLLGV